MCHLESARYGEYIYQISQHSLKKKEKKNTKILHYYVNGYFKADYTIKLAVICILIYLRILKLRVPGHCLSRKPESLYM